MAESADAANLSPEEMRRRVIGLSFEHDTEDREFWRHADDTVRGRILYELLARGEAIRGSTPNTRHESRRLILREDGFEIQER